VVTALVQAVIGGSIGLAVTGVPRPMLLTAVMFCCSPAQVGPGAVAHWRDSLRLLAGTALWGIAVLICVVTSSPGASDNFLRPILIRKGAELPLAPFLPV
jgi:predicted PurR-regulated permease PerM